MKAAFLQEAGSPLEVMEVPSPRLQASSVRVRVSATHILPFTHLVVGGHLPFPLPTPYIPGLCAIGVVDEAAEDVTGIKVGQHVFCSPLITERSNSSSPEKILKGWFGVTAKCESLLQQWKDGAFAEYAVYPAECVTPIDAIGSEDPAILAYMYYLCIAYGALLRGEFKPGQSVIVNGATGNLGAAAVAVALAMGASGIYAVGRNQAALHAVADLNPQRITSIPLPENKEAYGAAFASQIGEADLLVDAVGLMDHAALVQAGISVLRLRGTAVFLGGVSTDVPVNYLTTLVNEIQIKGSWMYPAAAPAEIARMLKSGLIDMRAFKPKTFTLNEVNDAVKEAASSRGLEYVILQP